MCRRCHRGLSGYQNVASRIRKRRVPYTSTPTRRFNSNSLFRLTKVMFLFLKIMNLQHFTIFTKPSSLWCFFNPNTGIMKPLPFTVSVVTCNHWWKARSSAKTVILIIIFIGRVIPMGS